MDNFHDFNGTCIPSTSENPHHHSNFRDMTTAMVSSTYFMCLLVVLGDEGTVCDGLSPLVLSVSKCNSL